MSSHNDNNIVRICMWLRAKVVVEYGTAFFRQLKENQNVDRQITSPIPQQERV